MVNGFHDQARRSVF